MVVFQVVFFLLGETLAQSGCWKEAAWKARYRIRWPPGLSFSSHLEVARILMWYMLSQLSQDLTVSLTSHPG